MEFIEAMNYLHEIEEKGSKYTLDSLKILLDKLSNPQDNLKYINVAGTNGKGSVCAYLTNIFVECDYKTGTFTSPHVFSFNENITVNNCPISNEDIARILTIIKEKMDEMQSENLELPTAFEIELAMALYYFNEKKCKIVILEAGLGGKNDATNIVPNKKLAIITSISLDHTNILGSNVRKIAQEKFGIVDKDLVTYEQSKEIMSILRKAPNVHIAPIATELTHDETSQSFMFNGKVYMTKMIGYHELINVSLVLKAVLVLRGKGYYLPLEKVDKGIFNTEWKGRCQVIRYKNKTIILDGAHNFEAAKYLKDTLVTHFAQKKFSYVFGVFKDKNYNAILDTMKVLTDNIYILTPTNKRGLDLDTLYSTCEDKYKNIYKAKDMSDALDHAMQDDSEVIVVFGSLSILKDAQDYTNKN